MCQAVNSFDMGGAISTNYYSFISNEGSHHFWDVELLSCFGRLADGYKSVKESLLMLW